MTQVFKHNPHEQKIFGIADPFRRHRRLHSASQIEADFRGFFCLSWGIAEERRRFMRLIVAEDCGLLRDVETNVCAG